MQAVMDIVAKGNTNVDFTLADVYLITPETGLKWSRLLGVEPTQENLLDRLKPYATLRPLTLPTSFVPLAALTSRDIDTLEEYKVVEYARSHGILVEDARSIPQARDHLKRILAELDPALSQLNSLDVGNMTLLGKGLGVVPNFDGMTNMAHYTSSMLDDIIAVLLSTSRREVCLSGLHNLRTSNMQSLALALGVHPTQAYNTLDDFRQALVDAITSRLCGSTRHTFDEMQERQGAVFGEEPMEYQSTDGLFEAPYRATADVFDAQPIETQPTDVRVEPRVSSNRFTLPDIGESSTDDDDDNDEYLDVEREQPVAVEQRTDRASPPSPSLTFSDAAAAAADMSRPQIAAQTPDDARKARTQELLSEEVGLEEELLLQDLANEAQKTEILAVGRRALDDIVKLHPELAPKKE
jgi:hypothetical protein